MLLDKKNSIRRAIESPVYQGSGIYERIAYEFNLAKWGLTFTGLWAYLFDKEGADVSATYLDGTPTMVAGTGILVTPYVENLIAGDHYILLAGGVESVSNSTKSGYLEIIGE